MLPRARRLSRLDILSLKKNGRSLKFPYFSLVVSPSSHLSSRFTVVTPLSLSKSAVIRNKLRRLIYSSLSSMRIPDPVDCIIYPKPAMLNLSREELESTLNTAVSSLASA